MREVWCANCEEFEPGADRTGEGCGGNASGSGSLCSGYKSSGEHILQQRKDVLVRWLAENSKPDPKIN
jgi:hypothetical protein